MNYDWTQGLFFAIIQKSMEKSYWLFVEGTRFMLTADAPTEWRHVPRLYMALVHKKARDQTSKNLWKKFQLQSLVFRV